MNRQHDARPEFDHWLRSRKITSVEAAERLGTTPHQVRRYRRAFGDPLRQRPSDEKLAIILEWTEGDITPLHFYPLELRERPADEDHHRPRDFMQAGEAV